MLQKTDEYDRPLSGGVFQIFSASDTAFATPLQSVAAINGVVRFTGLLPGDYAVRELAPPYGYKLNRDAVMVSLVVDPVDNVLPNAVVEEAMVNVLAYGTIELMKVDGSNKPLAGAKFGLYMNGYLVDTATSNASGVVRFTDVLFGDYTVKEITAPAGYAVSGTTALVRVADTGINRPAPYTVVNIAVSFPPETGDAFSNAGFALLLSGALTLLFALRRRRG